VIRQIDAATGDETPISVPQAPCESPDVAYGALWTATCNPAGLARIDAATHKVTGFVPLPIWRSLGGEGAIGAGSGGVWVVIDGSGCKNCLLARVDPHTMKVVARIPVSERSSSVRVGYGAVWVVSPAAGTVQKVSPSSNKVIGDGDDRSSATLLRRWRRRRLDAESGRWHGLARGPADREAHGDDSGQHAGRWGRHGRRRRLGLAARIRHTAHQDRPTVKQGRAGLRPSVRERLGRGRHRWCLDLRARHKNGLAAAAAQALTIATTTQPSADTLAGWAAPSDDTTSEGRVTVQRMDNVGIVVESLDTAISFFAELGLELEGRMMIEGDWSGRVTGLRDQRVETAMMRTPDGHGGIELSRFLTPPVVADHRNAPVNALGYLRVMFAVDDLDDTLARLRKHGAQLVDEVVQYENVYRLCYVRGPEGILIGLAEQIG
jgi:catechol 2,3-dioxygenase-like lactoylglutathione lyase family enzyme